MVCYICLFQFLLLLQICKLVLEKARQMHLLRAVLQVLVYRVLYPPHPLRDEIQIDIVIFPLHFNHNPDARALYCLDAQVPEICMPLHHPKLSLSLTYLVCVFSTSQLIFENTAVISKIFQCFKQPDLRFVGID